MNDKVFGIEDLKKVLSELFEVDEGLLNDSYDLSTLIKDSIDLGELVAVLKNRYSVEPKDWESFKTNTSLIEVFSNFE